MARALSRARARAALAALVFALASAVYLPIRGHEWLNYDDDSYVSHNPELQRGIGWQGIRWALHDAAGGELVPARRASRGCSTSSFTGSTPGASCSRTCCCTRSRARCSSWRSRGSRASFRAAPSPPRVFAVHPLHVESVAWISARKDVLSGVFFMLALLAYAAVARARRRAGRSSRCSRASRSGLLAKPTLVTLPCVLLLLDAWPLGRLARGERNPDARRLARALLEKLPLFAPGGALPAS